MPDGPQCRSFARKGCLCRHDLLFEVLNVVGLLQVLGAVLCLDQLSIEMYWCPDDLVLLRQNLNFEDYVLYEDLIRSGFGSRGF